MYSTFARTRRAFSLAILVTIVLALAPQKLLRWTSDFAEIIRVPMRPFSHVGVRLGQWVRPPESYTLDVPEEARELVEHLQREADHFKQLYTAEQMEVASLRQTLEQIQRVPPESRLRVHLLGASIIARTPADGFAPVQLNRGSSHNLTVGSIALYEGVHLVGRISDVTAIGSTLLPLVHPNTGLLLARIATSYELKIDDWPVVQIEIPGDGTFIADVDETYSILEGADAIMDDPTWPAASRGMSLGRVTAIEDIEDQPLRKRLIITPRFQVYELSRVTLKIERDDPVFASVTAGEDSP